jgi:hypothetical protein
MQRVRVVFALLVLAGCAHRVPVQGPSGETIEVSRALASSLEFVGPDDKDYAAADATGGTGDPGDGKVSKPFVVRLRNDLAVYRLWAGPTVRCAGAHVENRSVVDLRPSIRDACRFPPSL